MAHTCEETCSDCMVSPPCRYARPRILCDTVGVRHVSITIRRKHKLKRKNTCELRKCCGTCGAFITRNTHECNKRFCTTCKENKEAGNLCFMRPLVKVPASSERVLYVFLRFRNDAEYETF